MIETSLLEAYGDRMCEYWREQTFVVGSLDDLYTHVDRVIRFCDTEHARFQIVFPDTDWTVLRNRLREVLVSGTVEVMVSSSLLLSFVQSPSPLVSQFFSILPEGGSRRFREFLQSHLENSFLGCSVDQIIKVCAPFSWVLHENNIREPLSQAMQQFLKVNGSVVARDIALYLHETIKRAQKDASAKSEALIDVVLFCVKHLENRDVFIFVHSMLFSRRLLGGSYDAELEQSLISRVALEVGVFNARKLRWFWDDWTSALEIEKEFHVQAGNNPFSCKCLRSELWNVEASSHLPAVLQVEGAVEACERFSQWFSQRSGESKKVAFVWSVGQALLTYSVRSMEYQLSCTSLQALVLLQFNDVSAVCFEDLCETVGCKSSSAKKLLKKVLRSLCVGPSTGATGILVSVENGQGILHYSLNAHFHSKYRKLRFPIPEDSVVAEMKVFDVMKQTEFSPIDVERKMLVESTIVKVVKSRKRCTTAELQHEVQRILRDRFAVANRMLKVAIENLISRDYVCRSSENAGVLLYIA
eukprot:ANDGO_04000.mRNA.1 Cullin-3